MSVATMLGLLSAVGIVVGLVYSGTQTLLLQKQTRTANRLAATSEARATIQHLHGILDRFAVEPRLADWFLHGKEYVPGRHDARVPMIAEQFLDVLGIGIHTMTLLPETRLEGWRSYTRHILAQSPVMRALVIQHPDWWEELVEHTPPLPHGEPLSSTG